MKTFQKNTIRVGGSTAAYTVDTVYAVDMLYTVYTVDMVFTVDLVYTVDMVYIAFHCLNSSMYA